MRRQPQRWLLLGCYLVALTFAPSAAADTRVEPSFFGVYAEDPLWDSDATRPETVAQQASAGVAIVRVPFDWHRIEVKPGVYDFHIYDWVVAETARQGISVLPTLLGAPYFYSTATDPDAPLGRYPPRDPSDMARFAALLVRRYGPSGSFWRTHYLLPYKPIRAWQVWNEPNIPAFWPVGPDPTGYTELLRAVAGGIRRVDSTAAVVTAGLTNSEHGPAATDFLDGMYRAGARGSYDDVAVHPYAPTAAESVAHVEQVRQTMDAHGDATPIWVTEFGWASGGAPSPFTTSEAGQAARIRASFEQLASERGALRLRGLIYYDWRDAYTGGPDTLWTGHAGLLHSDRSPKPAFDAFRTTVARLTGSADSVAPPGSPVITEGATTRGRKKVPSIRLHIPGVMRVRRGTRVALRLRCVGDAGSVCTGRIWLQAQRKAGHGARAFVGGSAFRVRTGHARSVRVRLGRLARRRLRLDHHLRLTASAATLHSRHSRTFVVVLRGRSQPRRS